MAYRIRYETYRSKVTIPSISVRIAVCCGILIATVMILWLWPEQGQILRSLLIEAPTSAAEKATVALADAVFSGKGWYYGFTAFFAGLLEVS